MKTIELCLNEEHYDKINLDDPNHSLWFALHLDILFAKAIYYDLVKHGFQPISDESYDRLEEKYKVLSKQLELRPTASELVGWAKNPLLEAMAMRRYNKPLYERLKGVLFELRGNE